MKVIFTNCIRNVEAVTFRTVSADVRNWTSARVRTLDSIYSAITTILAWAAELPYVDIWQVGKQHHYKHICSVVSYSLFDSKLLKLAVKKSNQVVYNSLYLNGNRKSNFDSHFPDIQVIIQNHIPHSCPRFGDGTSIVCLHRASHQSLYILSTKWRMTFNAAKSAIVPFGIW